MSAPAWAGIVWGTCLITFLLFTLFDLRAQNRRRQKENRLEGLCDLEDLWNLPAREPRRQV